MYRFTKAHRLLKKSDFDRVFKQAKRLVVPGFTLLFRGNDVGHSRLGLVVPKKIIARAHERNRVKRLARETFRQKKDLPAFDIIVLVRKGEITQNKQMMSTHLDEAWNKLTKSNRD